MKQSKSPLFALLLLTPLFVECKEPSFSSKHVTYKDNVLSLDGNVVFAHDIGTLSSEKAEIQGMSPTNQKLPSSATFLDKVAFNLTSSSSIECDLAHIDFVQSSAKLESKHGPILLHDREHQLELSCMKASLNWDKDSEGHLNLSSVRADDEVELVFSNKFHLFAEKAEFEPLLGSPSSAGLLHVFSSSSKKCVLEMGTDRLYADEILCDSINKTLSFTNVSGGFNLSGDITFVANRLSWDYQNNSLTLLGNVEIQNTQLGKLFAKNEIQLTGFEATYSPKIEKITTSGPATLETIDGAKVTSDGQFCYDAKEQTLLLQGKIEPVTYSQSNLTISSRSTKLQLEGNKPSFLFFKDDILITSDELSGSADLLSYDVLNGHLELIAEGANKVLFKSKDDHMSMLADKIIIERNPITHKNTIRGVGKVHFTVDSEEKDHLLELLQTCVENLF